MVHAVQELTSYIFKLDLWLPLSGMQRSGGLVFLDISGPNGTDSTKGDYARRAGIRYVAGGVTGAVITGGQIRNARFCVLRVRLM